MWPEALIDATRGSRKSHAQVGVEERRDERARRAVDVHRDVEPRARLQIVERGADLLDRLVRAVERRAEDRDDADRVLVAELHRLLGGEVKRSPSIGTRRISTSQ